MPQGPGARKLIRTSNGRFKWQQIDNGFSGRKDISDFASLFKRVAKTSHFQVEFDGFSSELNDYFREESISKDDIRDIGLLCHNTNLPKNSSTSFETIGNRTGIIEKFASYKMYDQSIVMTFYVDKEYKVIKFFEAWRSFIHGTDRGVFYSADFNNGGDGAKYVVNIDDNSYFVNNRYPDEYKSQSTFLYKFDNDYQYVIAYEYRGLYPESIVETPLNYSNSDVLKLTISFRVDRIIPQKISTVTF